MIEDKELYKLVKERKEFWENLYNRSCSFLLRFRSNLDKIKNPTPADLRELDQYNSALAQNYYLQKKVTTHTQMLQQVRRGFEFNVLK